MGFVEYALLALGALAMLVCSSAGMSWMASGTPPRALRFLVGPAERLQSKYRARFRPQPEPMPPVLLGLELRRLAAEVAKVDDGDQPAKAARLAACRWAYDYVLLEYCRTVDLPVPRDSAPLSAGQRFEAEATLIGAGHGW